MALKDDLEDSLLASKERQSLSRCLLTCNVPKLRYLAIQLSIAERIICMAEFGCIHCPDKTVTPDLTGLKDLTGVKDTIHALTFAGLNFCESQISAIFAFLFSQMQGLSL